MENLTSALGFLYSQMILRDLFGKIFPGSILILVLARLQLSWTEISAALSNLPAPLWLLAAAAAWLGGFAIQSAGEVQVFRRQFIRYDPVDVSEDESVALRLKFERLAASSPFVQQRVERIVVIKDATGNTALALAISGFILMLSGLTRALLTKAPPSLSFDDALFYLVLCSVFISLFRMHRVQVKLLHKHLKQAVADAASASP